MSLKQAQGKRDKVVAPSELKNQDIARKSLVARLPIRRGEAFSSDNLTMKRPGNGLSPYHYWKVLGKQAKQDIAADELLAEEHFM
jgi:N-acetylneuraminate synthase